MNGSRFTVRLSNNSISPIQTFYHFLAVDFFNHLNMLYGTVTEFCIPSEVCPSSPTIRRKLMFDLFSVPNYVCGTTVRFICFVMF